MPAKPPAKPDPKAAPPPEPEPEQEIYGTWEGERNEEKLPHGQGKATYPNGDIYIGRIENNNQEKQGKYIIMLQGLALHHHAAGFISSCCRV